MGNTTLRLLFAPQNFATPLRELRSSNVIDDLVYCLEDEPSASDSYVAGLPTVRRLGPALARRSLH
jgi:hypothetical protein